MLKITIPKKEIEEKLFSKEKMQSQLNVVPKVYIQVLYILKNIWKMAIVPYTKLQLKIPPFFEESITLHIKILSEKGV